ncbi:MAG TPA: HDIG domain-containing protein, partial [Dehalococcoidia bacterium]|nr:HDIG domain-containing protein [Dehalococcoidia bacterium]
MPGTGLMMTAKRQADHVISPLQAFVFAVVLSVGLILILIPVLPGDAPLDAGDVAYKTFKVDGQTIVARGDVITSESLDKIKAGGLLGNEMSFGGVVAAMIVGVMGGGALGLYLYLFQPREVHGVPRLFMTGMLVLFWVAAAKVFLSLTLPDSDRLYLGYILPVAAAPMLLATLLDGGLAIAVAGLIALLAAFAGFAMPDARAPLASEQLDPLQMAFGYLFAGVAGVFALRRAERVNAYAVAGFAVGLVTFTTLLTFWLLNPEREGVDLLWMLVASALGGFGSAVVAVGGTVVLGLMFGVTTRIQLMELAQLSHPLLRQLQEKAPGTFHHSVIVGNLGERAADLVGADPLLVRVGCYFHDIGKIARPGYYIENQPDGVNPHDRLEPAVSAKFVAEHVKAGMELTAKYRVPAVVRAFVPEHHGTRLITYFYRKASAADPTADPEKFRYPGPKPQSRETGIVMLSDSVEAVVRSSKDRSFERIDELV